MNCHSESSVFSFPINSSKNSHDIYEIEKTAVKALKNIHLIYKEIMTPKEHNSDDGEIFDDDDELDKSFESPSYPSNQQKHYLKSCCSTLKELCVRCDRIITQCSSCNQCNCSVSKNNIRKIRNDENLNNVRTTYRPHSAPEKDFKVRCTVPKPFSFNAKSEEWQKAKEYKISKLKQDLDKEIEKELKIRANFKPVPKNTHLPLYNKMVEKQEKHKIQRKEKCFEILNSAKPFNLQTSKTSVKAKSSSDLTAEGASSFKAKPVPKHILSNKVSEKMKNKEEVRKMLMIERAKQTKEQATSPFSQRPITYSRSLINLLNLNKTDNKEGSKPKNISEITKRLYIKKCNETMDSWNKKVLLVDSSKKMENQENVNLFSNDLMHKKQTKKEELPFMYFPVRMSNAAILREKQIRADILARKEREKRKKEDELAKKKINTDILYKLKDLIISSDGEKEIDEKVKMFRESQIRRKLEYEKELEEIMQRVAEQTLLLERQSKIKQIQPKIFTEKESDNNEQEDSITVYSNEDTDENSTKDIDENSNKDANGNSSENINENSNEDTNENTSTVS